MTVIIPESTDDTPADDTTVVVAPVIVNDTGGDNDGEVTPGEAAIVEDIVEDVLEDNGVEARLSSLESRVDSLEAARVAEIVEDIVEDSEPDIVVNEDGDGDVIVTGDESPVGVPWTHRKPSLFGSH